MEKLINNFIIDGEVKNIEDLIDKTIEEKKYDLGLKICEYSVDFFPNCINLLLKYSKFLYLNKEYEKSLYILETLVNKTKNDDEYRIIKKKIEEYNLKVNKIYKNYNSKLITQLSKRKCRDIPFVSFCILTNISKNTDDFKNTINSFINCCQDINLIDEWICIDEGEDKDTISKINDEYPFIQIYVKPENKKGINESIKILKSIAKTPYIFLTGEKQVFNIKSKIISKSLGVFTDSNVNITRCISTTNPCINFEKQFSILENFKCDKVYACMTKKKDLDFLIDKESNIAFLDENFCKPGNELINSLKMHYEKDGENMSEVIDKIINEMEGEKLDKLRDKYKDVITDTEIYCINLEKEISKKDIMHKMITSKMRLFNSYNIYPGIDGKSLDKTYQLSRIFDNSEHKMNKRLVGADLSHIDIYTNLLYSKKDKFIIFEDDIKFCDKSKIDEEIINIIRDNDNKDWDIIYLSTDEVYNKKYLRKDAYIINKKGAIKVLEYINKNGIKNTLEEIHQNTPDIKIVYYNKPIIKSNKECKDINLEESLYIDTNYILELYKTLFSKLNKDLIITTGSISSWDKDKIYCVDIRDSTGIKKEEIEKLKDIVEYFSGIFYTINNDFMIILTEPNDSLLDMLFYERLKQKGVINIQKAIHYSNESE